MGAGRNRYYNPRTGKRTRPKAWYDKGRTSSRKRSRKKSGCYVATAVFGSYDCPQVWTLRRYRDNILAETWYGRAFIHSYYAVSPSLVKWLGETEWFNKMWKPRLNKLVKELNDRGIEDTPYQDKNILC